MKKVFNSLFVIIAAMVTFAGCAKQEIDAPATPETKTVQFFANSIETKTAFGTPDGTTYPTLWNVGDKVKVLLNIEQVSGTEKVTDIVCETDLAESARFEVAFAPETAPESYTYYAVCPSSAYNGKSSKDGRITVVIPAEQMPLETTVDKAAQIIYAVAPAEADQTSVDMDFHHLTAYGKFSLINLTDKITSVSKVKIVAPEGVFISGKWNYLVADRSIKAHDEDLYNYIEINTTRTDNIWFACGPVDLSGQTVKFVVTTDLGDLEKEVTFPGKFESGKIASFKINMDGINPPVQDEEEDVVLTKVTDVSQFTAGVYIIVSEDEKYYLPNFAASESAKIAANSITKVNSVINLTDDMLWRVKLAESGLIFESDAQAGMYLVATKADNDAIRIQNTSSVVWTATSVENHGVVLQSSKATDRYLSLYSTQDWRYYKSSNIPGSSKNQYANLYKVEMGGNAGGETPVEKTLESIAVSNAKTVYTVGDEFEEPTVTATYSDGSTEDVTASAEFDGYNMSAAGTYPVTVTYSGKTTTYSITVSAAQGGGEAEAVIVLNESFANSTGTMGWSGNAGAGTFVADNNGWVCENKYGAGGSAKFGTGSKKGIATTPALGYSGNMVLTFKAGAWNGTNEQTTLMLDINNGGSLSVTSVTMLKGEWTVYTVDITGATANTTITFSGKNESYSRFLLDDVMIVTAN